MSAADRKNAETLLSTGASLLDKAAYIEAASRFEQAASVFAELRDASSESTALNQAGLAHLYGGTYVKAQAAFERALKLDERLHDNDSLIEHLNNSANVYFFQGTYSLALDEYRRALTIADAHSSEAWAPRRIALTSLNLAVLYEQVGQNQRALKYYVEAKSRAAVLEPAERGQLLSNLGTLYRRLGDPSAALATYRDAQHIFSETHHADAEIHVLENIGIARALDFHDLAGAIRLFTEALAIGERNSDKRQMLLAHLFRAEALLREGRKVDAEADFNVSLASGRAMNAREEQWTAFWGLGRLARDRGDTAAASQRFMAAIEIIESLRSGLAAPTLRSEFLGNKRDVYDAEIEILTQQPAPDQKRIFRLLEQARERTVQDRLRKDASLSLSAIQKQLRSGDLLLAYWLGKESLAIFQIRHNAVDLQRRSFNAAQHEQLNQLLSSLRESHSDDWRQSSKSLGASLLPARTKEMIGNYLFIVPDGALNELPFETLDTGNGLLVEHFDVNYLPSAAILHRASTGHDFHAPWFRQVAAFGDPLPIRDPLRNKESEYWTPLPYSGQESRLVAYELPGKNEAFLGNQDLKRNFFASIKANVPLLHLSTHGVVDTTEPESSRLLFSEDKQFGASSQFLFLSEVAGLKLDGTQLITLSACDTERGKNTPGEGLHTFSRALLSAGASSTLTTLWRVGDQSTAEFMRHFYFHLKKGESEAAALRSAKLTFLKSTSELKQPRQWAAFVLNGEGRSPIPYTNQNRWWLVGALLLACVAFAVMLIWRRGQRGNLPG